MRKEPLDLRSFQAGGDGGYRGEHNAATLEIKPPQDLKKSADYYRVAFSVPTEDVPDGVVRTKELYPGKDGKLRVTLWNQLTQQSSLDLTLEGYKDTGDYIGKSNVVSLTIGDSVDGPDVDVDGDPQSLAMEVSELRRTAFVSADVSEYGIAFFNARGDQVEDVPIEGGTGGTTDHNRLRNRDMADQHPASAISGLEDITIDGGVV